MQKKLESQINELLKNEGFKKNIRLDHVIKSLHGKAEFAFIVNPLAERSDDPFLVAKSLSQKIMDAIPLVQNAFPSETKKGKHTLVFINLKINPEELKKYRAGNIVNTLKDVLSENFGQSSKNMGKIVIVEHTSANPIAPIHVGNLRNTIHGDTFARILKATGYEVRRHFYINDVGLQIGFTVIGYEFLKKEKLYPDVKFDHWIGKVYAIMNSFYSIQTIKQNARKKDIPVSKSRYTLTATDLKKIDAYYTDKINEIKKEVENLKKEKNTKATKQKISKLNRQINKLKEESKEAEKYVATVNSLKIRFPELFDILKKNVKKIDLIAKTSEYLEKYEKGNDKSINSLFRELTDWTISAFKWTLKRYNVDFDAFDYESDITWNGSPKKIVDKLAKLENTLSLHDGTYRFTYPKQLINKMYQELKLDKKSIPIKGDIPDLQLTRSDGTALYPTKDIAYSLYKFHQFNPEKVYNVISDEQTLPQFQLLLPLYLLGEKHAAKNLIHYRYGLVELLGRKMSGRQAIYITADEYYDETKIRARMAKKAAFKQFEDETWEEEEKLLTAVTLASTRFPLIDTDPNKKIVLDLDRELDFKRNPGPFILYAHARAAGILRKAVPRRSIDEIDWKILAENKETIDIIDLLATFEQRLMDAVNDMNPSKIASWCYELAQKFMKFYEQNPILSAEEQTKEALLWVVTALKKGIATGLSILGIPAVDRL